MKKGRKHSMTKWAAVSDQPPATQIENAIWGEISSSTRGVIDFLRYCSRWRRNPPTKETEQIMQKNARNSLIDWLIDIFERRDTDELLTLSKAFTALKGEGAVDSLGLELLLLKSMTDGSAWVDEDNPGILHPMGQPLPEWPPDKILEHLKSCGVCSDWTTVRRRLSSMGIDRKPGRPKKPRNS